MAFSGTAKVKPSTEGFGTEDQIMVYGNSVFVTFATTVEVSAFTVMEVVYACVISARTATDTVPGAGEFMSHDGTVNSSTGLTVLRNTGTTTGLGFDFIGIGQPAVS